MTNLKVVIGANFGDEGKGLMVDYFANEALRKKESCIVVLSNGGAQRGHTVTTQDGVSHVFKHFGAGTMAGADSYFPAEYIVNPMEFRREYGTVSDILWNKRIYMNRSCRWTTPYDMMINQIVEEVRDSKRHGSCGMGIWETVSRYIAKPLAYDLFQFARLPRYAKVTYLESIRDGYMMDRLNGYGIKSVPVEWKDVVYSVQLIENFIDDVDFMINRVTPANNLMLRNYKTVIFENGQGLLLDQNQTLYGDNTTPSNTGVINSLNIANSTFDDANMEVCYVSRTYMTRHGAGRFEEECAKSAINSMMVDETNGTNEFQGHLRYGELDTAGLLSRVASDLAHMSTCKFDWTASLGMTHLNEKDIDFSTLDRGIVDKIYGSNARHRESVVTIK